MRTVKLITGAAAVVLVVLAVFLMAGVFYEYAPTWLAVVLVAVAVVLVFLDIWEGGDKNDGR